ncbi:MAG: LptF/LptG family permease [Ferruginibacter sp.]|nr:YjgP/YjgQ family permease [Ferruginibacter sp.]
MKILDKYIISRYLITFLFCLILFTAIVVVVDLSEKTEDFSKSNLSAMQIFSQHYLGFIPRIDAMLFPLFVFISVIFFASKMAGRSEVIAILSSGVTFRRFLLPFLIGGLILTSILWLGYRYVVPVANRKWAEFEKKYIDVNMAMLANNTSYKQNIYFKLDSNSFIGIKGYDTISKTGNGFFMQKFENNKLAYNIRASNFNWDTASKKWKLTSVAERIFNDSNESIINSIERKINFNFKPIDLRKDDYLKDEMSTPDLDAFIKREKIRGSEMLSTLNVERYNRDAIPVSVLILTIIGAVLASKKVRGGSGAHIALGVVLSMAYILLSRFSVVFATKGSFSPIMAAWMPNVIFGLLALYLYNRAAK